MAVKHFTAPQAHPYDALVAQLPGTGLETAGKRHLRDALPQDFPDGGGDGVGVHDGQRAVLHRQVTPDAGTLTMRCRMTKVSEAADIIIENFDFEVLTDRGPIYTGDTYFGFFSTEALAQQKGLGAGDPMVQALAPFSNATRGAASLTVKPPITPDEAEAMPLAVDRLELSQ